MEMTFLEVSHGQDVQRLEEQRILASDETGSTRCFVAGAKAEDLFTMAQ